VSDGKSLSISDMQKEAYETSASKGWHDDVDEPVKYGLPARLALIHSEVSEALEDFRDGRPPAEVFYLPPKKEGDAQKPCGIPIELADVVIRIGDFCGKYGIDLEEAIKIKLKYNLTRPPKHGGKVV
jgi:hypothetical protein